jgi:hypothetical protein
MVRKITKTLLIGAMFTGLVYGSQSVCAGWSLNPFTSNKSQAKTYSTSATKKSPSALDKVGTGTKNLLNKTGETLGLKKPQPKKAPAVVAAKPRVASPRYQEKKNLFSWLAPKDKPKPTTVKGWIDSTKPVIP